MKTTNVPRTSLNGGNDRSREKYTGQQQQPTKLTSTIDNSKAPPRPSSAVKPNQTPILKKDSMDKQMLPPPFPLKPRTKEENVLTESKMVDVRNGLQLLKKKMSQRGMSRDKPSIQQQPAEQPSPLEPKIKSQQIPSIKKTKVDDSQEYTAPTSQKNFKRQTSIQSKQKQQSRQAPPPPPEQSYYNPHEQIKIQTKNVDFEKMIEMQMRLEANKQRQEQPIKAYSKPISYGQEEDDGELYECAEGCGRRFRKQALEKHENICKKVFQKKRKQFDSAAHRKIQAQNGGIPQYKPPPSKQQTTTYSKLPSKQSKQTTGVPKWKLQSAALRAGIKQFAGRQLTKQQQQVGQLQKQLLTPCPTCGRKFNTNAAQKHIPSCQERARKTANRVIVTGPKKKK